MDGCLHRPTVRRFQRNPEQKVRMLKCKKPFGDSSMCEESVRDVLHVETKIQVPKRLGAGTKR